jgi:membrane-associated phospholipid phosphatase
MMKRIHTVPISRQGFPISLDRQSSAWALGRLPCPMRPRWPLVVLVQLLAFLFLSWSVRDVSALETAAIRTCDDGRRTLKRFPLNTLQGTAGVFSRRNIVPLLVGSGLAGTAAMLDDELQGDFGDRDDAVAGFVGDNMGPAELGLISLGVFVGGRFSEAPRFRAMSYDLFEATIVNLGYTGALKVSINRERPDGSDEDSFPSGHTSNAFMLASVTSAHYGMRVGIPAYVAASAVGVSRLRSDVHWFSDVVAGATLGYIVGRTVVWQNNRPMNNERYAKRDMSVMPVLDLGFLGVKLEVNF